MWLRRIREVFVGPCTERLARRRVAGSDRGQITLLILGFFAIVLLMVAVVTDATKAYLVRADLAATADAAALHAADGLGRAVYEGGLGERADIDVDQAERLVAEYLARWVGSDRFADLTWSVGVTGDRVVLRMTTQARLPFAVPGTDGTATVGTEASAVAEVG